VHLHDADTMVIDIVYPFHALKPLASVLRSQMFLRSSEISSAWKDALHDAVMDIPLEVRSRLAETCITMNQLLDIQNDMIIPLPAIEGVDIYLNGQRQMRGVLGQKGTQAAIEITEILYLQNENGMTE
jgi:flagellar motor switch protein FliM